MASGTGRLGIGVLLALVACTEQRAPAPGLDGDGIGTDDDEPTGPTVDGGPGPGEPDASESSLRWGGRQVSAPSRKRWKPAAGSKYHRPVCP